MYKGNGKRKNFGTSKNTTKFKIPNALTAKASRLRRINFDAKYREECNFWEID
jgi:hypothetical protein